MRLESPVPAMGTHRSRGMERMAALPVFGSNRITMIVSERRPGASPSVPMEPKSAAAGSAPSRVSEPTSR